MTNTMRDRDARIVASYEAGATVDDLSAEFGLSAGRLRGILRAARQADDDRRALTSTVVEGELVDGGRAVRPFTTQAERDRVIDDADEVFATIAQALAPNTVTAYKAQWQRYLHWCHDRHRTPLPATRETLLSYLKDMKREDLSIPTIRIALAALKRVHAWGGDAAPEWVGGDQEITDWVAGYARERARDPDKAPKRAAGARMVIMRALLDALPADQPYGVRDRAILLLGYYMAARRSELANLRTTDLRVTVDGLEVHIGYSKTDQTGEGAWVPIPANDRHPQYDTMTAAQTWLDTRSAAGVPGDGPLFVPINRYGQIQPARTAMSGQSFEVVMTRAVGLAYARAKADKDKRLMGLLDPERVQLSPHSLRRGFATDARASAWDLLDITRHGRWSPQSKAVHIYIEEAERWLRLQSKPIML